MVEGNFQLKSTKMHQNERFWVKFTSILYHGSIFNLRALKRTKMKALSMPAMIILETLKLICLNMSKDLEIEPTVQILNNPGNQKSANIRDDATDWTKRVFDVRVTNTKIRWSNLILHSNHSAKGGEEKGVGSKTLESWK